MDDVYGSDKKKGISIGIIGPDDSVKRILKVLKAFPSFDPVPRPYEEEDAAPRLAEEIADGVEAILVSGPLPYRRIREEANVKTALHAVPLTDTGFYRALARLKNALGPDRRLRLSIDTLGGQMVGKFLKEIGESRVEADHYGGSVYPTREELIAFHRERYESGACDGALTAEGSVARALAKLGVPNEWVIPTDENITVALERALLSTETRQSKEAQIVVGLLNADHFEKRIHGHSTEHEVQKFKLDIHRMLLDYVESLDGYLTPLGGDEYLFFTTRGIFERETGGYKTIPLGKQSYQKFGLSLSIGIGFGRSANEAGTHARAALRKAKEAGGDTCFIVREDKTLIGPLAMADSLEQNLSLTDAELLGRVESAGMTSAYLSKLLSQTARTGRTDYMAHELAALLNVTVRTAHRLLLQWIDHGLVRISGVEKVPKGRPRQIFRLSFLADEGWK
ncbi:hypothetical protein B1A99_02595 [Cohnella sp. CIP 111063]|jgi:hypothetical protein|uniref:hypothetical protein n=1 Tax=unclassified Cohnella TaxID=2636738 RepID=UPI000B8BD09D|nr:MULTISPECIES: hypothetical protein [unclassified Cohnella]OXS62759.1 hypothetical protein B1A99_02595 [Cohnella sp. CIP 111063]PRX75035.1 hypothetical protein B0G52_101534 [Cohnella sp. SGD-V74]